jgi:maleate isomerase
VDDVQARIIANYAASGIEVVAEVHFGLADNFSFSEVDEATIAGAMRAVAEARPDAIIVLCTNLNGAGLAAPIEAELGIPVYDSVSAVLWKALALCGEKSGQITGWGSLFAMPAAGAAL